MGITPGKEPTPMSIATEHETTTAPAPEQDTKPPAVPENQPETTTTQAPDSPPETATLHKLSVVSGDAGDDITWNPDDPASVEAARDKFNRYLAAGNLAYKSDGTEGGEQIRTFDRTARHITIVAPLQGG